MNHMVKVERLRPAVMRARPVRVDGVFDDPDSVVRLIRERAPYVSLAEFHQMQAQLGGANARPFFRTAFTDERFIQNQRLIQAARDSFEATIVQPIKCLVQLSGPMGGMGVHLDGPLYRGLIEPTIPVWLMMNMTYSELFADWMVPIASGVSWFYRGEGGAFAFWPDGPNSPPQLERGPFWNRGVMCDNEYLFHGVSPVGTAEDRAKLEGTLNGRERLHAVGESAWEIRDGDRVIHSLASDQLRISLLWKAYVFRDEQHLASFENPAMNLTIDQMVEIYIDDLATKGIRMSRPKDLFTDEGWREVLEATYPQPLSPHAADALA
jgi:hypothetical protein